MQLFIGISLVYHIFKLGICYLFVNSSFLIGKVEDGKTHGNDNIQPTQIEAWHVYLWSIIGIFTHFDSVLD